MPTKTARRSGEPNRQIRFNVVNMLLEAKLSLSVVRTVNPLTVSAQDDGNTQHFTDFSGEFGHREEIKRNSDDFGLLPLARAISRLQVV